MILREPATALDPRVRTLWLVENLLATGLAAALVVGGTITAAMLGAATVAWLVGVLGRLVVVGLVVLSFVSAASTTATSATRSPTWGSTWPAGGSRRYQVVPHARADGRRRPAPSCALGLVAVLVRTASSAGGSIPGLTPTSPTVWSRSWRRAGLEEA